MQQDQLQRAEAAACREGRSCSRISCRGKKQKQVQQQRGEAEQGLLQSWSREAEEHAGNGLQQDQLQRTEAAAGSAAERRS